MKLPPAELKKLLGELNPAQRQAILKTLRTSALVIAGAGSGKTRVLQKRTSYLLKKKMSPYNLLIITFTNKAASELKERVGNEVGEEKAKKISIGTFHSLAVRWLHQYHDEAGLKKNWVIYDEDDQKKLMKKVLKDLNMDSVAAMVSTQLARISDMKNALTTPAQFRNQIRHTDDHDFYRIYSKYQDSLQRNNALDFDDLIIKMVFMLKNNPDVRKKFNQRFKYVMVDEYQDTNEAQYQMVKLITGKNNIMVVGDDYQGIYGWRGADLQKILNFQKDYPDSIVVKLEQNYRSTQTIVEAGNAIMKHNKNQMEKVCFTKRPTGDKIKLHYAHTDDDEARFIAEEIQNLVTYAGYDYKDVAILYRTNVQSRQLEDKLMVNMIPYNIVSGFSFYQRKEIKDILSWLQLSINPDDDLSCERVLGTTEGIGKTTVDAMKNKVSKDETETLSLYDVVEVYKPRQAKAQAALAGLTQIIAKLHIIYQAGKDASDTPVSDMLELIFKYTNYIEKLKEKKDEESLSRVNNVYELIKIAKGYEENATDPNVQDFLDQIALTSQQDKVNGDDEVQMMTLHSAKGLEFPVVFMIGLEEGLFPHSRSQTDADLEEERRLAYVGITRAQDLLYMSSARIRMNWDRTYKDMNPSRFITELPKSLMEVI